MLQTNPSFVANPAERLTPPGAASPELWLNRYAPFLGALLLHASVLFFLLYGPQLAPEVDTAAREIPVEIVVEQPPPPPPPPPEQPKPPPQPMPKQMDLTPAFDAPRAANDEKIEREAPDEITRSLTVPKQPDAPDPGAPPAGAAGPTEQGAPQAPQIAADPSTDKPDAEVIPKREEKPDKQLEQLARTEAKSQPDKRASPPGFQIPKFEALPDIEFSSAAAATPVAGGKAKSTYLSILYAKIMAHLRVPPTSRAGGRGAIVFMLDGFGNIIERRIARSSGVQELDVAALQAVGRAAPFPSPPQGMPLSLTFAYGER
jgi:TonB family protein